MYVSERSDIASCLIICAMLWNLAGYCKQLLQYLYP